MRAGLAGALVVGLLASGCGERARVDRAEAAAAAPSISSLGPWLEAESAAGRFSGAVLVARGDRVLFREAYGLADRAKGEPLTPEHRFRIASVSKQFTAALILRLHDRGVLDVDDPVCRWVSPCPEAWRPVTLHHLLSHQSGVPDLMSRADWGKMRWRSWAPAELAADSAGSPLEFPPGSNVRYSNAGYNLLGLVVERATGRPYAEHLRTDLLDPLGLKDTGYDDETVPLATGYDGADPRRRSNASVVFAAGGLYSTVGDLHRWNRALHGGRLLSRESHRRMVAHPAAGAFRSTVRYGVPQTLGYGLLAGSPGRRVDPRLDAAQIFHSGSWSGFLAFTTWSPREDVTVVVLQNDYRQGRTGFLASQRALAEALGRSPPERLLPRPAVRTGSSAKAAPSAAGPA